LQLRPVAVDDVERKLKVMIWNFEYFSVLMLLN